jgi:nicotinamidase/pyrazinamidase
MPISLQPTDALLVIDIQNDFCPGGALAVEDGDTIIPLVNHLAVHFPHTILTQDWHPSGHISFATTHPGRSLYETIQAPYGPQNLWPDHCLQNSPGAAFHSSLHIPHAELTLRKGFRPHIDSYSAFLENDHLTPTGLAGYLCVRYSAIDGANLGFETIVIEDATRPVNLPNSIAETNAALAAADIPRIQSNTL